MSAPVITDGITRIPLVPGSNASVNGDKIATLPLVHRAPGQLWERVAEMGAAGVVNSPNYTARIADAFRTVRKLHGAYDMKRMNIRLDRLTPAGQCRFYRDMDARYQTAPGTPLHHDGRCPIHH